MTTAPPPRAEFFSLHISDNTKASIDAGVFAARKQFMRDAETQLCKVLCSSPSKKKELRMFFASTLSSWENISVDSRMRLKTFLFADPRSRFSQKLMQLVCLRKPVEVAQLLSSDDRLFRRFFREDTTANRAKAWFAHFNFPGPFEKGALALERYAMTHRDQVWNRLVWLYSTAPSPVVIAHQKIRFLELDVVRTVQMLVDEEPSFWSSEFFRESLLNGDFLALDYAFFAEELCRRLDSPQVRLLAESCLRNEPFRELCNRVLLELDDKSMLHWLYKLVPLNEAPSMEQLFVTQPKWSDLEELMLFSALLTQSKAVTKLLAEEPSETQATLQSLIIASIPTTEQGRQAVEAAQLAIEREALDDGAVAYAKAAILVSFIMRMTLLTFYADRSSLQSIFKQEKLAAEIVFEQPLPREVSKRDKKSKKRARDEEDEPIFIGWRFPGETLTYSVRDTCQSLLPELFLRRLAAKYKQQQQKQQ